MLAWVAPAHPGQRTIAMRRGMWVRIISYRVTDERLGEPGKVYRLVTTLLNPRVAPALDADRLCIMSAGKSNWSSMRSKRMSAPNARSYAPRRLRGCARSSTGSTWPIMPCASCLAQAAVEAELDPDRLSFTEGLFELTEMISLALTLEPEEATEPLLPRLRHKMAQHVLPPRRLRINRREIKQIYNKYKPKKRQLPPPEPFDPEDQFLDFVELLDPLASALPVGGP